MQAKIYKWGVIHTHSKSAYNFCAALEAIIEAQLVAYAYEDTKVSVHAIPGQPVHVFETYADLFLCKEVELVYIPSHPQQLSLVQTALNYNKGVVYEPPISTTSIHLKELFKCAKSKNCLLLEGITMCFMPPMQRLMEIIHAGSIGEILGLDAEAHTAITFDPQHPFFSTLGGGIFHHHGLYPLFFGVAILGKPVQYAGYIQLGPTGIEELYALTLRYPSGVCAQLSASCLMNGAQQAHIIGTKSLVEIERPFYEQSAVSLYTKHRRSGLMKFDYQGPPAYYLIKEAHKCYSAAQWESDRWSAAHTLMLTEVIETCQQQVTCITDK